MRFTAFASASCATALFATSVLAQDVNISLANVTFQCEFNSTNTLFAGPVDVFTADPLSVPNPAGVLFKSGWIYRLNNDTQETIFKDVGATFLNAGHIGGGQWLDVDSRGLIRATVQYTAIPISPNSGGVLGEMAIQNISGAPLDLTLFHFSDIDLCGFSHNLSTTGSNGIQRVTTLACVETATHLGANPDRWEVSDSSSAAIDLYNRFIDNAITNLNNTAAPIGPTDVRGAYQWDDTLQPNEIQIYRIGFLHNYDTCLANQVTFGNAVAGGQGVPTLTAPNAVLGAPHVMTLDTSDNNVLAGFIAMGLTPGNQTFGDLTMYINNNLNILVVMNNGAGSHTINIPASVAFCNLPIIGQGFPIDSTSTSTTGLPITQTRATRWIVGGF